MPSVELTSRLARESKPGGKDTILFDKGLPGFGLRIHPSGRKVWIVQARIEGRSRRMIIARYGEMDLARARRRARDLLQRIRAGANPADDILREKRTPTVKEFAREYLPRCDPYWKPSGRKIVRIYPKARMLPAFGKMPVDRVGPENMAAWFDAASKDRPGAANRAFEILRSMMFRAEEWGFRERGTNPCVGITKNPRRNIARFLDRDELARLGKALDARQARWPEAVAAIRLLALTGCRRGEVLDLRWRDIRKNAIVLPDSKTGPRSVPLGASARAIVDALPGPRRKQAFLFPKNAGRRSPYNIVACWRTVCGDAKLGRLRLHDLRHYIDTPTMSGTTGSRAILHRNGRSVGDRLPRVPDIVLTDLQAVEEAEQRVAGLVAGGLAGCRRQVRAELDRLLPPQPECPLQFHAHAHVRIPDPRKDLVIRTHGPVRRARVDAQLDPVMLVAPRHGITAEDFARVNPNTGTAAIFRSRRDAELTTTIYGRVPVMIDRSSGESEKSWPVKYSRMFDMTNDSGLFRTRNELVEQEGAWPIGGNHYDSPSGKWVPLYEGKMVQAFDHRAANIVVNPANVHRPARPLPATVDQHRDPNWLPEPQFWVSSRATNLQGTPFLIGLKHVTATTNIRSMIAALIPGVGAGNSLPVLIGTEGFTASTGALIVANLNSILLDYVLRQKVQGQNLNLFILEQLPVVPLLNYDRIYFGSASAADIVRECVLELTYTARDMAPFAREMGYLDETAEVLPPFSWNEERRLLLRAKLDAVYFHLYGVTDRDQIRYVYSTFPIVERQEQASYGIYRSLDFCLAWINALSAGEPDANIEP